MVATVSKNMLTRASKAEVLETARLLWQQDYTRHILNVLSDPAFIVNENLQIVFANHALVTLLNSPGDIGLLGKRLGEALDCIHATDCAYGCGTSEACQVCGAYAAMRTGLEQKRGHGECQIQAENDIDYDFEVTATPLPVADRILTLVTVKDIADSKRRQALERIFFHDLINTASLLSTQVELMMLELDQSDYETIVDLRDVTEQLVQEIHSQRMILAAEAGELVAEPSRISANQLCRTMTRLYQHSQLAQGKQVRFEEPQQDIFIETDMTLLSRVIGNMLKNAIEASDTGQVVTLRLERDRQFLRFIVHNEGYIPQRIQLQIFKRSFSTKGQGRGLGTYSMRILSERYLYGKVDFQSRRGKGTSFTAEYPLAWPVKSDTIKITAPDFSPID